MEHMPLDRRGFLKLAAANAALAVGGVATAGAALQTAAAAPSGPAAADAARKLRVACIGVGGMGAADLNQISAHPQVSIVALCDIDRNRLADAKKKHTEAREFVDFREMFETFSDEFDAVVVSTPDHTHAPATMMALNRDKHVYCQKPLTHDVYEARQLAKMAASKPKLVTQMGTQGSSNVNKRQAFALLGDPELREKTVGRVNAVYGWSDRPAGWWPQGITRPESSDPVPDHVEWDLWIGTAPMRPFANGMYHPFDWRGCYDFGCGALGDMACHILDVPYYGLDLGYAKSVVSHNQTATKDRYPNAQEIVLTFPGGDASGGQDIPLYWTDGGIIPHYMATRVARDYDVTPNACVVVGDRGSLHVSHPDGKPTLFVLAEKQEGPRGTLQFVEEDISSLLPSFEKQHHYHHWVDVALGKNEKTQCRFELSGPMTEALCLGAVAARYPHRTLLWNAEAMEFTNEPSANELVRRKYREGFEVENL